MIKKYLPLRLLALRGVFLYDFGVIIAVPE